MFQRILLDYGHGGTDARGVYHTPGAKQYRFKGVDGGADLWIGEGDTNRETAWRLARLLAAVGIEVWDVVADRKLHAGTTRLDLLAANVDLRDRVRNANRHDPKTTLLVSLHSNAQGDKLEGPSLSWRGISIYTSRGQTRSDEVATSLHHAFAAGVAGKGLLSRTRMLPGETVQDGDPDYEADFYVLKHTRCPAVLGEVGFFTNLDDARILLDPRGQWEIAACYFAGLLPFLALR